DRLPYRVAVHRHQRLDHEPGPELACPILGQARTLGDEHGRSFPRCPSHDYRNYADRWPPSSATPWPLLRVIPGDQPGPARAHRLNDGKPGAGLLPVAWLAHLTTLLPPRLTGRHPPARRPAPAREKNQPAQPGGHSNCTP